MPPSPTEQDGFGKGPGETVPSAIAAVPPARPQTGTSTTPTISPTKQQPPSSITMMTRRWMEIMTDQQQQSEGFSVASTSTDNSLGVTRYGSLSATTTMDFAKSTTGPARHRNDATATEGVPRLIGREEELRRLNDLLKRIVCEKQQQQQQQQQQHQQNERQTTEDTTGATVANHNNPTVAFIHGRSGVGKTALVDTCLHEWANFSATEELDTISGGKLWVARGKYDQFTGPSQPYSAILVALESLGQQITSEASTTGIAMNKKREEYERHMHRALKFEGNILAKLVPSFKIYNGDSISSSTPSLLSFATPATQGNDTGPDDSGIDMTLASERLAVALMTFLKYFCTNMGPIVMFLDDLHWADDHSFDLIMNIIGQPDGSIVDGIPGKSDGNETTGNGPPIPNFVLLAGYRDEESGTRDGGPSTGVATRQSVIEEEFMQRPHVINIHVRDLDVSRVELLLRGLLQIRSVESFEEGTNEDGDGKSGDEDKSNDVRALAKLVHNKTFGNPYFVLQQLEYLHSHKLLTYNFATLRWEWDLAAVRLGADKSDNVIDIVSSRVGNLPPRVKRLLQLASCLGFFVEMDVLELLEHNLCEDDVSVILTPPLASSGQASAQHSREIPLQSTSVADGSSIVYAGRQQAHPTDLFRQVLSRAEEEGFVECSGKIMKFSHDRIQQSVYGLLLETIDTTCPGVSSDASTASSIFSAPPIISAGSVPVTNHSPVSAEDVVHYRIGVRLQDQYETTKDARFLFMAAEQIDRVSSDFLLDRLLPEEILGLIELNRQASKLAKQKGQMQRVATFLSKAISLSRSSSFWRFHYDLMLELYNSSAEVEFGLGRLDSAMERINVTFENAVREVDRVRAMVVQFQMYGHQRQFVKAIAEGREILKLLGEPIPKTGLLNIMKEYFAVKKETKKKTDAFFVDLPKTRRDDIRTVLKVLQISAVYGWNGDPLYSALAFLRAMRITVREGSDVTTPFVYSGYGYMLAFFGDEKEAFRFGQLALDKNEGKASFPSSCTLTYLSVLHLQLPFSVGLEPLLSSYRVGLETGDLFFGTINISCYALVYFSCGLPLGPFAADMSNYMSQLRICKQYVPLAFILPTTQLALNLMGKSEDPYGLSRDSIKRTQHEHFSETVLLDKKDASVLYMMYLEVFQLFILDADISKLENSIREIYKLPETRLGGAHTMNYFFAFVDGLVGLRLTRYAQKKKPLNWWTTRRFANKLSRSSMTVLRKWVKTRPVNSVSLLALLDAEQQSWNAKISMQTAKRMYDKAISQFARSGIMHYGAVANELAGLYMVEINDMYWAKHYLSQACMLYAEWNAVVKVQQLCESHDIIEFDSNQYSSIRFAIQGRSRFNAVRDSLEHNSSKLATALAGSQKSSSVDGSSFLHKLRSNRFS